VVLEGKDFKGLNSLYFSMLIKMRYICGNPIRSKQLLDTITTKKNAK